MGINNNKRNRAELKSYFVKNAIPIEEHFADLIDAMLNQKDDGVVKLPGDPLSIQAVGDESSQKKALSFYRNVSDAAPAWVISLNPRKHPNHPATASAGFSISNGQGQSRLFIDQDTGQVGLGTTTPQAKLEVASGTLRVTDGKLEVIGGAITPSAGNSKNDGIFFPENPGGGAHDAAWIRYYPMSGESTVLEIGTSNNANDHIALFASGNVGIGTREPRHKLHVQARDVVGLIESTGTHACLQLLTQSAADSLVEIANRPGGRLALHVPPAGDVFNISKDGNVGIGTEAPQAKLEVNGDLVVTGTISGTVKGGESAENEDWQTPELQNNWVYYGSTYNPAGYYKDSQGIVHLRGLVKDGEIKKTIFTLPEGYRPQYRELQIVCTAENATGRVDILTNGEVFVYAGAQTWLSLDSISFRAHG